MGLRLVYEALEIEKLLDEEKAAKDKGPVAEQTFQDKAVEEAVEKKKEEQGADSDSTLDTPSEGEDTSSEEDPSDTDTKTSEDTSTGEKVDDKSKEEESSEEDPKETPEEDGQDDQEDKPVQESLREIGRDDLALETFSENMKTVGRAIGTGVGIIYRLLEWSVTTIAGLIGKHGPDVLRALYKGVIYTLAKTVDVTTKFYTTVDKAIERRMNSTESLKTQLKTLKDTISQIESRKDAVEDMKILYGNRKVIDSLKAGEDTDVVKNLETLDKFLQGSIGGLNKAILTDIYSIQYLSTLYSHSKNVDQISLLRMKDPGMGLSPTSDPGYSTDSEFVQAYRSKENLPGDIVLVAQFPKPELKTMEAFEHGYKESQMFLKMDMVRYHQVSDIEVVGFEKVKSVVSTLEKLVSTLEKQQTLYEDIRRTKPGVVLSIKRHAMNLVESNTKVRYSDSLVGPMHLKSSFIAKVYLVGSLDIHDYAARTISNGLSFAQDLAKKYS